MKLKPGQYSPIIYRDQSRYQANGRVSVSVKLMSKEPAGQR